MIKIGFTQMIHKYSFDTAYVVMRSPKNLSMPVNGKNIIWLPELSPSEELFADYLTWKKTGSWNEETFQKEYVPRFIKQLSISETVKTLDAIGNLSKDKVVYLLCSCPSSDMCHRSILAGWFQMHGYETCCKDYRHYFK